MSKIPFNSFADKNFCIIIPTYNNSQTLENILLGVIKYTDNVIVINDGSTDDTSDILKKFSRLPVINQKKNFGKGYALRTGLSMLLKEDLIMLLLLIRTDSIYPTIFRFF